MDTLIAPSSSSSVRPTSNSSGHLASALPEVVFAPQVQLLGRIEEATIRSFQEQLAAVPTGDGPIAVEVMTMGGDAEMGRRLALEVRLAGQRLRRRLIFLGKTTVYSAGVTMMAGFQPQDRFLTQDTMLLIHARQVAMEVQLDSCLHAATEKVRQVLAQLETGLELERQGFAQLVAGTEISLEEVNRRALEPWYLPAKEALQRGLVGGLI